MFLKFGLLYSGVGIALLFILFCIRYVHYQSYIFILNWLKKMIETALHKAVSLFAIVTEFVHFT